MNIYEFAKNREKQAEGIYCKLAESAANVGIANIFMKLADAEKHHYEIIEKMERAEKVAIIRSDILVFAQNTIRKINPREPKLKAATSQIEVYRIAQVQEAESESFYREQADKSADEQQRKVLLALAKEEHQHFTILENIIEFISYPENHPENAEFNQPTESQAS